MRVQVVLSDPQWPVMFAVAAKEIVDLLGGAVEIHHIGSTSIPRMPAKPIIDMLAIVSDLTALDSRSALMESLGYEVMGEFGIAGRRYFRRNNAAGERKHQVHAFKADSPHIARHLAFRDYLRAHPKPAKQYAALKIRLAAAHPHDIEAYMEGKDQFIKEMEARALAWIGG